ncbi:tetratricopeptide repeat protein [Kitasatospora sp. NPDC006697]|uniref:tetratricopeptide repeat protein n=1 Tax=Kitasatospora sp. NPDC006697 TaxID=3364020 RepID=UPI0036BEF232
MTAGGFDPDGFGGGTGAFGERSVATGPNHGIISTGNGFNLSVLSEAGRESVRTVSAPPGLSNLPRPVSRYFTGRQEAMRDLARILEPGGAGARETRSYVVHGMGGLGKSTIALHYAAVHAKDYGLVWWVTADSPALIEASLGELATRLAPTSWVQNAGVQERCAWAMTWLQWNPGWLLIFDNVDDPRHVEPYLGGLSGGHRLITSRRARGWTVARAVALPLLTEHDATDLLCAIALDDRPPTAAERSDAQVLAEVLGCLPLALEQAGATIHETNSTFAGFFNDLGLLLGEAATGIDPERTIARIWDISLDTVLERSEPAVDVLYALAWLAPDNCPEELLAPLFPTGTALRAALGVLASYNLISTAHQSVRVHRLLQLVLRERSAPSLLAAGPDTAPRGRREAEDLLLRALYPQGTDADPAGDPVWQLCMPHVIALAETAPAGLDTHALPLYEHAAAILRAVELLARATPLHERIARHQEQVLGLEHPDTSTARNNLARSFQAAGRTAEALALRQAVLEVRARTLGPEHPDTLTTRSDVAESYWEAGRRAEASALFDDVLTVRSRVLGPEHPDTLISRDHVAAFLWSVGREAEATTLMKAIVEARERLLGVDHPDTLTARLHLAACYWSAGRTSEAIALDEAVVEARERLSGAEHPDTLTARLHLAVYYWSVGRTSEAITLEESVLEARERLLGVEHPETLIARLNLAISYRSTGREADATTLIEAVVEAQERLLGAEHPDTLVARLNLAVSYRSAGRTSEAIALNEAVVQAQERLLGTEHPDTLNARLHLATSYQSAGRTSEAIALNEAVVQARKRLLGVDHPDTLNAQNNLAAYRRPAERRSLFRRLFW